MSLPIIQPVQMVQLSDQIALDKAERQLETNRVVAERATKPQLLPQIPGLPQVLRDHTPHPHLHIIGIQLPSIESPSLNRRKGRRI